MSGIEELEALSERMALQLDEGVPCDVGRMWDMSQGRRDEPTCNAAADWTALAHDCHMGQPILLCTKHLAMGRKDRKPDQLIKFRCKRCGMMGVSMDEVIWNIRRR